MSGQKTNNQASFDELHAFSEKKFIEIYLKEKGYTLEHLRHMAPEQARQLMKEASIYASNKLAEIEMRAKFVTTLHDAYSKE